MARPAHRELVIVAVSLAVAVPTVAGVLILGNTRHAASSTSCGEATFRAGLDANGVPMPRTLTQGGGMMGGGCASCHGRDGYGRTTPVFAAPTSPTRTSPIPKGC